MVRVAQQPTPRTEGQKSAANPRAAGPGPTKRPIPPQFRGKGLATPKRPRSPVLGLAALKEAGVEVREIDLALTPEERETGIAWVDSERMAEVSTGDYKLQRKLERAGFAPQVVNSFKSGGSIRVYYLPRSRLSVNVLKPRAGKPAKSPQRRGW